MTDDKKPTAPAKTEPRLVSITFPSPLTLINMTPVNGIVIGDKAPMWPADGVALTASAVYLRPLGSPRIIEIQRASCVLHWSSELPLDQAVTAMPKGGR